MHALPRSRRALAAAVISIVAATTLVAASTAHAGLLTAPAANCDDPPIDRPFVPWIDLANYVLAPEGALESAQDWSLKGDAGLVAGNETYYVTDEDHSTSLRLPPGSSATTAPMCVGLEHPTLRFFARNNGGLLSSLLVEVQFADSLGNTLSLPIGLIVGTKRWQPTLPLLIVANLLPLLPGDQTPVTFRFTPLGPATWDIDDVYVDPWRHR
jgi:hypothetical protein